VIGTRSSPAACGGTSSSCPAYSFTSARRSTPRRWPVGGGQQGDRHVPPLCDWRPPTGLGGLAFLGGVLLQHFISHGAPRDAV
jgi:hypothetical protein